MREHALTHEYPKGALHDGEVTIAVVGPCRLFAGGAMLRLDHWRSPYNTMYTIQVAVHDENDTTPLRAANAYKKYPQCPLCRTQQRHSEQACGKGAYHGLDFDIEDALTGADE